MIETIRICPIFDSTDCVRGIYALSDWMRNCERELTEKGIPDPEGYIARKIYKAMKDFTKHKVKKTYGVFSRPEKGRLGEIGGRIDFCIQLWQTDEFTFPDREITYKY